MTLRMQVLSGIKWTAGAKLAGQVVTWAIKARRDATALAWRLRLAGDGVSIHRTSSGSGGSRTGTGARAMEGFGSCPAETRIRRHHCDQRRAVRVEPCSGAAAR